MKKTLVAIAALTAVSAFAQSSVTIYGRVNEGYTASKLEDKAGKETKSNGLLSNSWTSSRFGVNVNEDLGNGQSAQAVWEANIGVTDAAAATGTVRQAFVGFTDKSLGSIQAGAIYTPEYTQGITVAGTVNSYGQGGGDLEVSAANKKTTTAVHRLGTLDASNAINYTAPKMGGVTLSAQFGTAGAQVTNAAGTANTTDTKGDILGVSATYANGPLTATASYMQKKLSSLAVTGDYIVSTGTGAVTVTRAASCTASSSVQCQTITAAAAAADTKQTNTTLSAKYAIGAANLFAYYADRDMSGTTVRNYTTYNLGANYTMGKLTPFVSYSAGKMKDATTTLSEPSATQIGASYAFSKRTNAYLYQAAYKDSAATTTNSYKASQTSLGLSHTF